MKNFYCFGRENEEDEKIGVFCVLVKFVWVFVSGFYEWLGGQKGVYIGVREV